jgi:hypothetical protein
MTKKDYTANLLTKEDSKWATKVTGKPEFEFFNQGLFYLTEVEGLDYEDALKIVSENWNK